jgi:hypothetical protein
MRPALALLLAFAACAEIPDLGPANDAAAAAPWPRLVPLEPVLAEAAAITISDETATGLDARGAALRARAARLRNAVVGDETTPDASGG